MKMELSLALVFTAFLVVANPVHAVFIGDNTGGLYDLDVTTNTSTLLGNGGVTMYDIALDPISATLYGLSSDRSLYSIDKTNGSVTLIGATGGVMNGLTFDSSGTLYGSGSDLYTLNLGTGMASTVGSIGFDSAGDIAFDSSGNLFMSAENGGLNDLISVNFATGLGALIGSIGFNNVYGLNFIDSMLFGYTLNGSTLAIDTTTGAGTMIATNGIASFGADGSGGVSVPEPATLVLMGLGLAGIGYRSKKAK